MRETLRRRIKSVETALKTPGADAASLEKSLPAWRAAREASFDDDRRIPFQDGLPPELEGSLLPYRAELERLFCAATGELDVMRTERSGIRYEHL